MYNISLNKKIDITINGVKLIKTIADTNDEVYLAGETIGGHKVVYIKNDSKVYIADKDNPECINKIVGITTGAVVSGESVTIRKSGKLNGFGTLTAGAVYYLGLAGAITTTAAISGFIQIVGFSIDADILEIEKSISFSLI